ncbi:polymer-forming cytoskeletal protein [Thermomonas sp.]|uniref:bactofilin family protein n=1 Tax=Thermomonas sp. TaxID=1971895 RepID=UPI0035B05983
MAIWKDPTPAAKANEPSRFDLASPAPAPAATPEPMAPAPAAPAPIRAVDNGAAARESVIAADLTIEGKIEGSGHVRIAGKFKGDVKVQGNLTIEPGAKVSGGVAANKVTLAGELDGNIHSAQQVELQQSGVINGDLKAGTLTVAAGSRIRGHVECGWDKDGKSVAAKPEKTESAGAA